MKCVFCNKELEETPKTSSREIHCRCENCGEYDLAYLNEYAVRYLFTNNSELNGKGYLFSGYINKLNSEGDFYKLISEEEILNIYRSGVLPNTIYRKLDNLLNTIYESSKYFGEEIEILLNKYLKYYAVNEEELNNMINALLEKAYIKRGSISSYYYITLDGITYLEKQNSIVPNNNQCFVAMWFNEEMMSVFQNTIIPTLKDLGYNALIISMVNHNDIINDKIIAEIRKSKFMIADFSGNRGGVYFEAGFAMGLGKQVIWTCSDKYFNKNVNVSISGKDSEGIQRIIQFEEERKLHFDIDHYNFIIWKDEQELSTKLRDRIEATIR